MKPAAQLLPYAPEPAFPQIQQDYQEVPVQQNKPAVAQSAQPPQYPSEYTPAPPQYYPSQQAGAFHRDVYQQPNWFAHACNVHVQIYVTNELLVGVTFTVLYIVPIHANSTQAEWIPKQWKWLLQHRPFNKDTKRYVPARKDCYSFGPGCDIQNLICLY